MPLLILNSGSSSLKFRLYGKAARPALVAGSVDLSSAPQPALSARAHSPDWSDNRTLPQNGPQAAVGGILRLLADWHCEPITAVGHRVVHGGDSFTEAVPLDAPALLEITRLAEFAPLHGRSALEVIRAAQSLLPDARHVAVFDTAFHQTLPEPARLYGLPHELAARHGIRRYGFHGLSHRHVMERHAALRNASLDAFRIVSCHLGSGSSLCAIDLGRSVETTMGFTPLEGLVMGTRVGTIDVAAVLHLMARESLDPDGMARLLNERSGLLGVSGLSSDMRELEAAAAHGHPGAERAIQLYCHRVKQAIGACAAVLPSLDGLVFTGGIGERSPAVRARVCQSMGALGVTLDERRNRNLAGDGEVSAAGARVRTWVIQADEESVMAREVERCLAR